jgi:hypothetical protein
MRRTAVGLAVGLVALCGAGLGWARAFRDAKAQEAERERRAALQRFIFDVEKAHGESGLAGAPPSPELLQGALKAGFTPEETVAVERAIDEIQRAVRPLGPAVSPPDGALWQIQLARSARIARPVALPTRAEAAVDELALALTNRPTGRPIDQILASRVAETGETVHAAMRRLRVAAHTAIRQALPRQPAEESDRIADGLAFGPYPSGLSSAELDAWLAASPPTGR